jgi:tellurite resistance protein
MLLLAILSIKRWIVTPHYKEHLNPSWMIPPLGNLVAAVLAPSIKTAQAEVGWLWFSFAYLMYITLFGVILYRVVFNEKMMDRLRPTLWIFLAAPAVSTSAYVALNSGWDNFARFNFYSAVVIFALMFVLTFDKYFGFNKFEMGYWGYAFPLDTLALVCIQYQMFVKNLLTEVRVIGNVTNKYRL